MHGLLAAAGVGHPRVRLMLHSSVKCTSPWAGRSALRSRRTTSSTASGRSACMASQEGLDPGRNATITLRADEPGIYRAQCAV